LSEKEIAHEKNTIYIYEPQANPQVSELTAEMEIPEGHEIMGMALQRDSQENITWVNFKTSLLTRTHDH
jgi:hypothetical protein